MTDNFCLNYIAQDFNNPILYGGITKTPDCKTLFINNLKTT